MRFVRKPRRELAVIERKRGRPSDIKVGILLPIPYRAAASSLFMHMAYAKLQSLEGVIAYRYVYDLESDVVEALEPDAPAPRDLDVLLVSLPYELDYPYAARCLHHGGIEVPLKRDRGRKPVVIGGGIAAFSNPAPLKGVLDAVAIGDAEGVLEELPYIVANDGVEGLCELRKVLVYGVCEERIEKNATLLPDPVAMARQLHPLDEEPIYGVGLRLEVSRGCPRLCAFCLEGHVTKPFRYYDLNTLLNVVDAWVSATPFRRVVLYSLSLLDVPYARQLLEELARKGIEASVPSLRPDLVDEEVAEIVRALGQRTLTIAPESLDPEVACRIGKCFDLDELAKVVRKAVALGMHVKLYLIAGLPGEDDESFVKNVNRFVNSLDPSCRRALRLSINPLIPKPWTPTQFLGHAYPYVVGAKLRKALRELRVSADVMDWRWGVIQAFLALGNESCSSYVVKWGLEGLRPSEARALLKEPRPTLSDRPWEHLVDLGVPPSYLLKRFEYLASFDPRWRSAGAS